MDRLLIYRNLLAAEDHLDEMRLASTSNEELDWFQFEKQGLENIRDQVMPEEADSRFHCYVKHLSVAYEAAREVAKATHSDSDLELAEMIRYYLRRALEKLWDAEVEVCGRCKGDLDEQSRVQTEDRGSSSSTIDD